MPLRKPALSGEKIGSSYEPPTSNLRSPEDNLTIWQFMSVTWLTPLIGLGSTRQLMDEDVWSLSYEFQHRRLHDNFRELPGSVLKRLLVANGLDLAIITAIGLVELIAS